MPTIAPILEVLRQPQHLDHQVAVPIVPDPMTADVGAVMVTSANDTSTETEIPSISATYVLPVAPAPSGPAQRTSTMWPGAQGEPFSGRCGQAMRSA